MIRSNFQAVIGRWKESVRRLKSETYALYLAYKHPKTPWFAKVIAGLVVAYAFSPIDLVPDFIPVLGYLDDLLLVPLGIALARRLIPAAVMVECQAQAQADILEGKPINWLMAGFIVAVWIGLTVVCILGLIDLLSEFLPKPFLIQ